MELRSLKAALESLEVATDAGTWVMHLTSPVTLWWSPGTRRLLEWQEGQPLPPLEEAIKTYAEPSRGPLTAALQAAQSGGTPFDLELELVTARGRTLSVRVLGRAEYEDGAVVRVAGSIQNIDRRTRAERNARDLGERLAEFEERWRLATEGSGLGVWDWDAQTNRVYFSPRWKSMLGYSEGEIGDTLEEWDSRLHPEDRDACYADLNAHLEGRTKSYHNEHRVRCKDGATGEFWTVGK